MGFCIVVGGNPDMAAPVTSILASDLAVGSSVYLMESGVATEYLVVNQGKPSGSSLYDDSCAGTWLLRKDIKEKRPWHSSNVNDYKNSTIHGYLNRTFLNLFDLSTRSIIKQIKIPYVNGITNAGLYDVAFGANGLSCKVFLLSYLEVGFTSNENSYPPGDGSKLAYFKSGNDSSAKQNRIAKLNGSATEWWLRSPINYGTGNVFHVNSDGGWLYFYAGGAYGIRPALVLPTNALFDKTTLILKGVA